MSHLRLSPNNTSLASACQNQSTSSTTTQVLTSLKASDRCVPFFGLDYPIALNDLIFSYCDLETKKNFNSKLDTLKQYQPEAQMAKHTVDQFTQLIISAHQYPRTRAYMCVEALKNNPSLAFLKMSFPQGDGSMRHMTALQKTFYSLHSSLRNQLMLQMLPETIKSQLQEYVDECSERKIPLHVDVSLLRKAQEVTRKFSGDEASKQCVAGVGGAQKMLFTQAVNFKHHLLSTEGSFLLEEASLPSTNFLFDRQKGTFILLSEENKDLGSEFYISLADTNEAEVSRHFIMRLCNKGIMKLEIYAEKESQRAEELLKEYQINLNRPPENPPSRSGYCLVM